MRQYLLDTAPLGAYLLGRPQAVAVIDPWIDGQLAATSILVYGEIVEYLRGLPDFPGDRLTFDANFKRFVPMP